jgi:hypothetical protein
MRVLLSPWSTRFARSGSLMKGACLAGHVWLAFAGNTLVHACVGVSAPSTAFVRPLEKSMRVSCGKEEREFCDADKYTERGRAKIPGGEIGVWAFGCVEDRAIKEATRTVEQMLLEAGLYVCVKCDGMVHFV